jgi:putative restriction endonuclease
VAQNSGGAGDNGACGVVRIVIGVTDRDWLEHLRARPAITEVNFWSPSPRAFRALTPGELFVFKLKAPVDRIVGGGVFAHAADMPSSLAWEAFGESNGAGSLLEMRRRIAKYRNASDARLGDFVIGCRILTDVAFWPEPLWLEPPASWARTIVSFKSYGTDEPEGRALWEAVAERMALAAAPSDDGPRFGAPGLVRPRLGQGAFRVLVTDRYARRCAVTGEKTLPALDAAHIRPYADGGSHAASNGLLLRRDIHSLFDAGYVTVTPALRFEVSPRIREEFQNGRHYYALHGQEVHRPAVAADRPDPAQLRWHNETVFLP